MIRQSGIEKLADRRALQKIKRDLDHFTLVPFCAKPFPEKTAQGAE